MQIINSKSAANGTGWAVIFTAGTFATAGAVSSSSAGKDTATDATARHGHGWGILNGCKLFAYYIYINNVETARAVSELSGQTISSGRGLFLHPERLGLFLHPQQLSNGAPRSERPRMQRRARIQERPRRALGLSGTATATGAAVSGWGWGLDPQRAPRTGIWRAGTAPDAYFSVAAWR